MLSSCCHGLLFISLITPPLRWSAATLFSSAHAAEHKRARSCARTHTNTYARTINSATEPDSRLPRRQHPSPTPAGAQPGPSPVQTGTQSHTHTHTQHSCLQCQQLLHPPTHRHISTQRPYVLLKIKNVRLRIGLERRSETEPLQGMNTHTQRSLMEVTFDINTIENVRNKSIFLSKH